MFDLFYAFGLGLIAVLTAGLLETVIPEEWIDKLIERM